MYKYSVIIPTLNEEKNISKLLDSILRQTIKPLEIIVADKSTDQTPKILKSYKVKVVEGVNDYHVGRARNNAAKIATGKYLFFLDADNLLLSRDYIESVLKFMEIHNLGASHGTLVPDDAKYSSKVGYTLYNGIRKSSTYLKKVTTDVGSGIVVRRDVYEKVGGFREDITTNEEQHLGADEESGINEPGRTQDVRRRAQHSQR